jgi:hypothetical protein
MVLPSALSTVGQKEGLTMKEYLKRLNLGSTLFALAAVAVAIAVIRTDLEHRPYSQLPESSPELTPLFSPSSGEAAAAPAVPEPSS